jgi:hypothetical protein
MALRNTKSRNANGTALAELGPALFLLILCMFFPMVNLCTLGASFAACVSLNHTQLREAALLANHEAANSKGSVIKAIPEAWKNSGIGQFVGSIKTPETKVNYRKIDGISNEAVTVTTTVTVKPFITVPLFNIPGLGAPISYTISSERLVENAAV